MTDNYRCTLCGQEVATMTTHVTQCPMIEHSDFDTTINAVLAGLMAEFPVEDDDDDQYAGHSPQQAVEENSSAEEVFSVGDDDEIRE